MKKSKRSPILEELLSESPKDVEERVKKLIEIILEERQPPVGLKSKWIIDEIG